MPSAVHIDCAAAAAAALDDFARYRKLQSWLLLHAAGIPALPGIVVTDSSAEAFREVARFASRWASRSVLLRSDSASERGDAPRGGYLVPACDVVRESEALLAQGRVVFLLEPASPFDDLYSANLVPDRRWRNWWLEVVGPGFDASDLKRGDVTPQETVHAAVTGSEVTIGARDLAPRMALQRARTIRIEKVAGMLRCQPSLIADSLRRRGETLLVDIETYPPIPEHLIRTSLQHALLLKPTLVERDAADNDVVLSLSFLTRTARLVFWDVVWPDAKYVVAASRVGDR